MENMNNVVESVLDKKYNRNSLGNIPKWLWAVLAYFAYDDILAIMSGPYMLALIILLTGAGSYLFATGNINQFIMVVNTLLMPIKMMLQNTGLFGAKNAKAKAT